MAILSYCRCVLLVLLSLLTTHASDLPPILDADDIAYFFNNNKLDDLHWYLSQVFDKSERNPDPLKVANKLPQQVVARGGGSTYSTEYKLKLDLEQAEYLLDNVVRSNRELKKLEQLYQQTVIPTLKDTLQKVPSLDKLHQTAGLYAFQDEAITSVYNKAFHHTDFDELKDDKGNVIPLLNKDLDVAKIQNDWFHGENAGIIYIDDLLCAKALTRIRQLMLESTVWYQTKTPLRFGGYVGAYIDDGLHDRILLQLAFELHRKFPKIFKQHSLRYLWAYKYDSDYSGINIHADEAAVNVNIWLTPNDANLDPSSGGLVVFTAKPPSDWDFSEYNTNTNRVHKELLEPTGYANVTIPHRQNRAVIFDSALFHHTDKFQFKPGYKNRRINLTLLYGKMQKDAGSSTMEGEL